MNTWYQINGKNLSFSSRPLSFYMETHNGLPYTITFDDGGSQTYNSGENAVYLYNGQSNYPSFQISNPLNIKRIDIAETLLVNLDTLGVDNIEHFNLGNPTAVIGSLNSFTNATGLTYFNLNRLPNANIDGSLNSFSGATGLTTFTMDSLPDANIDGSINSFSGATGLGDFRIRNLPNAYITGDLSSFSGMTGLVTFWIYIMPNAIITGSSSDFANKTNIRDFNLFTSPASNIVMNYDDILNIWQSSVLVLHRQAGIYATKTTTDPFNFTEIITNVLYFQNIGLSTASMDNMIISLDNSLITQSDPKTIHLDGNAPHSGSTAVMTALSSLASKNITVVL